MKPNSKLVGNRASRRRLIERLSGWRLNAFFISVAMNLVLLVGLRVLPLFLDSSRLFIVTAWVLASHAVFLVAVAGFRFSVSVKVALGSAHAMACLWALVNIDALPWMRFGKHEVVTLYLIPMITLLVTSAGVGVARLTGYHRSRHFSVADVLVLVTTFAILFPLVLPLVPRSFFADGRWQANMRPTLAFAAATGITSLVVSNVCFKFIPVGEFRRSSPMLMIGWFLFAAMVDWSLCEFSFYVGLWMLISLIPVIGIPGVDKEG